MFKHNIQYLLAALLLAITANIAQTSEGSDGVNEKTLNTWQRDVLVGETLGKIGTTLKCLMHIFDDEVGHKIGHAWDGHLKRVQQEAILKLSDDQYMDLVYEKSLVTLKEVQSIHPQCSNMPYPCNPNDHAKTTEVPKDIQDLQHNLENIGATMKCILSNDTSKPEAGIHSIFVKAFARYHGNRDASITSLAMTKAETSRLLSELKQLDAQCQMAIIVLEPCSPPSTGAKLVEKPLKALQRDLVVGENLGKIGTTLKCLMRIFDDEIGQKIYRVWDGNLKRVQQEAILKLSDDQYMDLLYEKVKETLKEVQTIHPQCANIPYPCDPNDHYKKAEVPKDIQDLQHNLESIGATMKCILANDNSDTGMHSIFAKSFARYHGNRDASVTSLVVTKAESSRLLSELQKLDTRCQMATIVQEPCSLPSTGAQLVEKRNNALQRDLVVGEHLAKIGTTLKCLMGIFDDEIGQKIYRVWDGNLKRVQQEAILKLTDDQYMDLLHEKVRETLKEVQTIHPQCANIPYPCDPNDHSKKTEVPKDIQDLQHNLESIGATMKCILANDKPYTGMHSIFAKSFARYHGNRDASMTSLVVTKAETSRLLSELKKLDKQCQMVNIGKEPCSTASVHRR